MLPEGFPFHQFNILHITVVAWFGISLKRYSTCTKVMFNGLYDNRVFWFSLQTCASVERSINRTNVNLAPGSN